MMVYIRNQLVCNFNEFADKNTCCAVLHDGCWTKVRELYMGDNHDPSLVTLWEQLELGKSCVQILWMRHLINCYGKITNSGRNSYN